MSVSTTQATSFDPANYWGKLWNYRGVQIERVFPSGYYSARVDVVGGAIRVTADTLAGIRTQIREQVAR